MFKLLKLSIVLLFLSLCSNANAATCFWVGGTGNFDNTNQASWSSSSGGAGSTCAGTGGIPKNAGDIATFDGSSGGGTVTVCGASSANCPSGAGSLNIAQITMGAFTGTLDFATRNPDVTLTTAMSLTGAGTRTLNMGSGTWTLSATFGTLWDCSTCAALTLNNNGSTIVFSASSPVNTRTFATGGKSYGTVTFSAAPTPTAAAPIATSGSPTFATLNISGPNNWTVGTGTITITNGFNWTQTSSTPIILNGGAGSTISSANNGTMSWAVMYAMTFSGGGTFTATNSLTVNPTTGITITPPSTGGGRIIGG